MEKRSLVLTEEQLELLHYVLSVEKAWLCKGSTEADEIDAVLVVIENALVEDKQCGAV